MREECNERSRYTLAFAAVVRNPVLSQHGRTFHLINHTQSSTATIAQLSMNAEDVSYTAIYCL